MNFKTIGLIAAFFTSGAFAQAALQSPSTTLSAVYSYNQWGNGDVAFKVANPIPECIDGYWLTKADAGFQTNMATILLAFQGNTSVVIYGIPSQLWSGSTGKYCKLYSIFLNK
jgi:hypothetical protein